MGSIINRTVKKSTWWTTEVQQKVKEKKNKWKRFLQTGAEEDHKIYKLARIEVKNLIKAEKGKSWEEFGNKMKENYSENQKLFYSTLKQLRQKKQVQLKNIKDKNGNIIIENEKIMERWREYFEDLTEERQNKNNYEEMIHQEYDVRQSLQEITMDEVVQAIKRLKIGRAPGDDNITAEMLKYMGNKATNVFRDLLNEIVAKKSIPSDWNIGIILPIYKKGDSKLCTNYRGITLTSIPGKILTRILENRLREKIEITLDEAQNGFRKGRSTQDPIFIIRQLGEKMLITGKEIHLCFVDLRKAFDRVVREDVWESLRKRNVDGQLIEMLKVLYMNNGNKVRTHNNESTEFETKIGLKQGYLISPLLFEVLIDDVIRACKQTCSKIEVGY